MKLRFNPDKLTLTVADICSTKLAVANEPYDGMSPLWEPILLPCDGTLRFRVSFPGLGYRPEKDKVIVDVGASKSWTIPQDGSTYYLSGTLSIEKEKETSVHRLERHSDFAGSTDIERKGIAMQRRDFSRYDCRHWDFVDSRPPTWLPSRHWLTGKTSEKPVPRLAGTVATNEELSIIGFGGIMVKDVSPKEAANFVAEAVDRGDELLRRGPVVWQRPTAFGPASKPYRPHCFLACKTT